jgi:hypothetical protein
LKNTKNVRKWSNRALSFLTGFTGGYGLTSFISTRFFQGQGLLNRIQPEATNAFTNVTGSTEKGGINFGEKINTTHHKQRQDFKRILKY